MTAKPQSSARAHGEHFPCLVVVDETILGVYLRARGVYKCGANADAISTIVYLQYLPSNSCYRCVCIVATLLRLCFLQPGRCLREQFKARHESSCHPSLVVRSHLTSLTKCLGFRVSYFHPMLCVEQRAKVCLTTIKI